jgi:hypothetical protein
MTVQTATLGCEVPAQQTALAVGTRKRDAARSVARKQSSSRVCGVIADEFYSAT